MDGAYNESIEIELKPLDTTTLPIASTITTNKAPDENNSTKVSLLVANSRPMEKVAQIKEVPSLNCSIIDIFYSIKSNFKY